MKKYFTLFNIARVIAAVIMVQTLFFKFTAHPESISLFNTLGMEPYGRIGVGVLELIASILLFVPGLIWVGAVLTIGLMLGAVYFHLTILGIDQLFWMAIITLLSGIYIARSSKKTIGVFIKKFIK